METKRLIVSTNYINLHARKREIGRLIESERERVRVLAKERLMKMKIKKRRWNRSRSLQQYSKSLPLFYFFIMQT